MSSSQDDPGQRGLDQFHVFPFSSDDAFQQGLAGILALESTRQLPDNERAELVLKTKVFYFNRLTGHNITPADLYAHTADLDRVPAQSGNERNQTFHDAATRTLTLAELKRLIEEGKTDDIPNNKCIPNVLHDGVPSKSTAPLRKKPWEGAS